MIGTKESKRRYREKNREKLRIDSKEYYKENREKILLKQQNEEFKIKHRKNNKKYRNTQNGKDIRRICEANRRVKLKNIIHKFTYEEWIEIRNSTNGYCKLCNKNIGIYNMELDHIYPISKAKIGRIYTKNDIQAICSLCNKQKGNKL